MVEPSASNHVKHLSNFKGTAPSSVGRREEFAWLEDILQEMLAGRPRVVLLPGEAGIGKTRLLQELRSDALRRGLRVGYGRGYEVEVIVSVSPQQVTRIIYTPPSDPPSNVPRDFVSNIWVIKAGAEELGHQEMEGCVEAVVNMGGKKIVFWKRRDF